MLITYTFKQVLKYEIKVLNKKIRNHVLRLDGTIGHETRK